MAWSQELELGSQAERQNPLILLDALYCSEVVRDNYYVEDFEQVEESCLSHNVTTNPCPVFLEQDLCWEEQELTSLFSKEHENELYQNLVKIPSLEKARREAVEWMLKVNAHYSFCPLTAVLAVNFFDKILCSFHFQCGKPWMTQLAAVACLSIAAKMEETQVPLLLHLQVEESEYVFEAKTIQRMEILVLSTLEWKMNPVTPLKFLDFITRRLGLKGIACAEFLRRCQGILLSVISDYRFTCYLPSVMATATMLHVVNSVEPRLGAEYRNQLLGILGLDKEKVDECLTLVCKLASRCQDKQSKKRRFEQMVIPSSPNGVMDVSFSSDSSNDSWTVATTSHVTSPEPLSKKGRRAQHKHLLNQPSPDFLSIPR